MDLLKSLKRFHAFLGLFIGPFIFIAALSGAAYALSLSLEEWMYRDILKTSSESSLNGGEHSLKEQIEVANNKINNEAKLFSIRPAIDENHTSRILYVSDKLPSSQYRTIFIDPQTLEIKADLITYGSGGAMPVRMWIDYFHRDLLFGDVGRWYSELAASWLWITGLSGIILFFRRKKKMRNDYQKLLNKHTSLGVFSLAGLLMLSITGLTWSEWAGENISKLRTQMQWQTPVIKVTHNEHSIKDDDYKSVDEALMMARKEGIDSNYLDIRPPRKNNEVWLVSEIKRTYPSEVDAISLDLQSKSVIDRSVFAQFPLMAKLTRWGIDLHMGILFGLINQILIAFMSLGICALVVTGYWLWIKRRGWRYKRSLYGELRQLPSDTLIYLGCVVIPVAFFLPLIFVSLIIFIPLEAWILRLKLPH